MLWLGFRGRRSSLNQILTSRNEPCRILLPHFSHYSDEWSELMQQYCSLDPTADLEDALKPYERRVRKVVKGNI